MTSSIGFLDLPSEIRVEIYKYLFKSSQLSVEGQFPAPLHCNRSICGCNFPYQLANTCRQLRREILPYLLKATTLQVVNAPQKLKLIPPRYLSEITKAVIVNTEIFAVKPLELDLFPALQMLELRKIAVWCKFYDEEYFTNEASDETMFWMAMFNLKRMSTQLFTLCNKADRGFNILLYCHYVVSSQTHETIVSLLFSASSCPLLTPDQHAVIDVDKRLVLHKSKGPAHSDRNAWAGFY